MPLSIELSSDQIRSIIAAARLPRMGISAHLMDIDFVEYASGDMDSKRRADANSHVAICPSCAAQLESLLMGIAAAAKRAIEAPDSYQMSGLSVAPGNMPSTKQLCQRDDVQLRALDVLAQCGAIERDADYALPSGLHSDTHINVSTVCSSEDAVYAIADLFLDLFNDVKFDTILAHGWTMRMIARRMAVRLRERSGSRIAVAATEGYNPPTFATDLAPSAYVLVLTDVFVTGRLIDDLRLILEARGCHSVGQGVIASHRPGSEMFGRIRTLCTIPFQVQRPEHCSRCGILPLLQFNPVSCCMTSRRTEPRSPTEFLTEHPEALEFWETIHGARACERHRVEHETHHLAFVNVDRLLTQESSRTAVVSKLLHAIAALEPKPSALIVPQRKRAKLLARVFLDEWRRAGCQELTLVPASRGSGEWHVDFSLGSSLKGQHVLAIDSAVGHGATVDEMFLLARQYGSATFGISTVVSRLSEAHEAALNRLTGGRFISVYRFPMRPLAVHQGREICPVCRYGRDLAHDVEESGATSLKNLLNQLRKSAVRRRVAAGRLGMEKAAQLTLPGVMLQPILERCSRNIAAGITLNALHASRNNGMAPLKLPELCDSRIPAGNRMAMIESLPAGVARWSGSELIRNLEACLKDDEVDGVWAAASMALARETDEEWIRLFINKTNQSPGLWTTGNEMTWDKIAYSVHVVTRRNYGLRRAVFDYARRVKASFKGATPPSVQKVMEITAPSDGDSVD